MQTVVEHYEGDSTKAGLPEGQGLARFRAGHTYQGDFKNGTSSFISSTFFLVLAVSLPRLLFRHPVGVARRATLTHSRTPARNSLHPIHTRVSRSLV